MTEHPYELWARVDLYAREDANLEAVLTALAAEPWPPITRWATVNGRFADGQTGSLLDALRADPKLAREEDFEWWHGDQLHGSFGTVVQGGIVGARANLSIFGVSGDRGWRWLVAIEEWLSRMLEERQVAYALVTPRGAGGSCLPRLDFLGNDSQVVAVSDALLATLFDAPDAAIEAGGWTRRRYDDVQLLSRALHARTPGERLGAMMDGQWAMARMARPGVTRYDHPEPTADELPIFGRGAPLVQSLGYEAKTKVAVFTCAPANGEHIHPWEIFALRDLLWARKLPTGEGVKGVEVIFALQDDAEREAGPLRDLGVHVRYYDDEGELATLGE